MARRDRHDIIMSILDSARFGKGKTELMNSANMSSSQTKQYIGMLTKKGLLEMSDKHSFRTTKKGLDYLEKCSDCFLCHWHPKKIRA